MEKINFIIDLVYYTLIILGFIGITRLILRTFRLLKRRFIAFINKLVLREVSSEITLGFDESQLRKSLMFFIDENKEEIGEIFNKKIK